MQLQVGEPIQKEATATAVGVSIVVPCFNEVEGLEQLFERLASVRSSLSDRWLVECLFVDDGSSDGTADQLEFRARDLGWARVLRHPVNRGIAAAIMTGAQAASHPLVVSMDADCTYDPMQLEALLPKMDEATAMVTASPYHPQGEVEGVPGWRLGLSKVASQAYRWLLQSPVHTYTSCFRLYRRSALTDIQLQDEGFVGIAEMLWQISRRGGAIKEVPAKLTSRRLGYSKMKTIPVILAHLKLMSRILTDRIRTLK